MSAESRPARADEITRLWPAVRAAHLFGSAEQLAQFHAAGPWRVRVTDRGEALVVARWRQHLDVLAIRGLWAPSHRVPELVRDACAVARAQGLARVLSPLVALSQFGPYRDAGLGVAETIVALCARTRGIDAQLPPGYTVRQARTSDLDALALLDGRCFDEFWRYGPEELADSVDRERVFVAEKPGTIGLAGYSACSLHGATATLGRLAVSPEARGQGLGAALCAESVRWVAGKGAETISLCTQESNRESRALYDRLGFSPTSERYVLGMCDA